MVVILGALRPLRRFTSCDVEDRVEVLVDLGERTWRNACVNARGEDVALRPLRHDLLARERLAEVPLGHAKGRGHGAPRVLLRLLVPGLDAETQHVLEKLEERLVALAFPASPRPAQDTGVLEDRDVVVERPRTHAHALSHVGDGEQIGARVEPDDLQTQRRGERSALGIRDQLDVRLALAHGKSLAELFKNHDIFKQFPQRTLKRCEEAT